MKSKCFSDSFLDNLSDDPLIGLASLCKEFRNLDQQSGQSAEYLEDYLNALAVFNAFAKSSDYEKKPPAPAPASDTAQNIQNIRSFYYQNEGEITRLLNSVFLEKRTKKYTDRLQANSAYVFSDEDYSRIQSLINEMREIIVSSDVISAKHKQRLLERLERLQSELHKTTSDLDRFWGFIGEAGVAIGKFGNDIKPLVDRIKELSNIVWKTIALKEMLLENSNPILLNTENDQNKTVAT